MAHNSLLEPSGWALITTIDPVAHMEALDVAQFESINGDQGGTWAPASIIEIGGSGLEVTGDFLASVVEQLTISSTGVVSFPSGATLVTAAGADVTITEAQVPTAGTFTIESGGTLVGDSGSTVDLNHLEMQGSANVTLVARNKIVVQDRLSWNANPSNWSADGLGRITNASTGTTLAVDIHVPHGATLNYVEVLIDGPAHGTWAPANRNSVTIYRMNASGVAAVSGPHADNNVQATYEAIHYFGNTTPLALTVNRATERYFAVISSEFGTNALAGTQVYGLRVTYSTSSYDED